MTPDQTEVCFEDAASILGVSSGLFNALLNSGLLGDYTETTIRMAALEDFQKFGTQWNPLLAVKNPPLDPYRVIRTSELGALQPRDTHTILYIAPDNVTPETMEQDLACIAQFYFRPNPSMYPDPNALALIGPVMVQLRRAYDVVGAELPTRLYPGPDGYLAMAQVYVPDAGATSYERAYNIVSPVLDHLAVKFDVALPIAHSLLIGVPSGTLIVHTSRAGDALRLSAEDQIDPGVKFPELREASALYREATSSNNVFHKFLTLWKAYENVCQVRGTWRKVHKRRDVKLTPEVIPDLFAFKGAAGKSFDKMKQELNDPYRVALAHGSVDGGRPRTAAIASDVLELSRQVPIIRYMARVAILNTVASFETTDGR